MTVPLGNSVIWISFPTTPAIVILATWTRAVVENACLVSLAIRSRELRVQELHSGRQFVECLQSLPRDWGLGLFRQFSTAGKTVGIGHSPGGCSHTRRSTKTGVYRLLTSFKDLSFPVSKLLFSPQHEISTGLFQRNNIVEIYNRASL